MIYILIGLLTVSVFFVILRVKLSGKWHMDRNKYDERDHLRDHLSKGLTIWMCIAIASLFCALIGYVLSNF